MPGTLYLVSTPIGNLEDITLRALRILKEADVVAAEDTRHTNKLLLHYQIETPMIAYHQHSDEGRTDLLVKRMAEDGESIALVTDAGTPGVSDPGHALVMAALDAGVTVVPVPGASAPLCALIASGLPPARFAFEGFLPRTRSSRREKLEALARGETRTLIFFEAGNRTGETLAEMAKAFGADRAAVVARELTKKHEEFARGGLAVLAKQFEDGARGEVTIVVAGLPGGDDAPAGSDGQPAQSLPAIPDDSPEALVEALKTALASGLSERDAVRQVSADRKLSRRDVYAAMIAFKEEAE
jgi:16S rRNA (cytidine1402-2'-O)-methyltransferase